MRGFNLLLGQTPTVVTPTTSAPEPFDNLFNNIVKDLPGLFFNLLGALAIFLIGLAIAFLLASLVRKLLSKTDLDNRITGLTGSQASEANIEGIASSVVFWVVMILALVAALNVLKLTTVSEPLNNFLNQIFAYLPRIGGAAIIAAIAWLVATITRLVAIRIAHSFSLDEKLTQATDQPAPRSGQMRLSETLGDVLYWFVFLFFLPAILGVLELRGPLQPVQTLLNRFLEAIPQILTALVILALGYVLGQFVQKLVTNLLTSIGFNNILVWLGLPSQAAVIPPPPPVARPYNEPLLIEPDAGRGISTRTPSEIAGIVSLVGILLFSAVAAIDVLNIPALTALVGGLLVIFGQILVGLAIFAVGLYFANLAYNLIASSGTPQSKILGQTAKIAILVLVSALALRQIGIAPDIINLAFGLLLGAISVAIAIAFGLGGRDVASEQLREWLATFKRQSR
ncbi:mechanosensitive ion channel [Phormidium sp. CLA17]|nr:mechanosensitive ion channel [Leptolyngbya sp. Cla-17]